MSVHDKDLAIKRKKAARKKELREANPGHYASIIKAWREANPDKLKAYRESQKKKRAANPDANRARARKWAIENPESVKATQKKSYAVHKQKWKERVVHKRYGLSPEGLAQMLDAQASSCKICGFIFGETKMSSYHVDHCHSTGVVRGLLCGRCNTGLGYFRDNPELFARAIEYLKLTGATS